MTASAGTTGSSSSTGRITEPPRGAIETLLAVALGETTNLKEFELVELPDVVCLSFFCLN